MGFFSDIAGNNQEIERRRIQRLQICANCVHLSGQINSNTARCKLCGCFLHLKTKVKTQKCPIGKW
jgi:hypothetical protein